MHVFRSEGRGASIATYGGLTRAEQSSIGDRRPVTLGVGTRRGLKKHVVRHVQEEEEVSRGRVSAGQVEHDAENPVWEGGQPGDGPKDEVLEGDGTLVAPQRSSAHGKP